MKNTDTDRGSRPLYFPVNCPDANDYVAGFGAKEFICIAAAFGVAVVAAVAIYGSGHSTVFSVLAGGCILGGTILAVRKDRHQESLVDQIRQVVRYHRAQKKFVYEYYNIYEGSMKGAGNG